MNLCLPPHRPQKLPFNLLDLWRSWRSAANCVWASSCFCFSYGCSAKWEVAGLDIILPIMVLGEEALGAEVPGEEAGIEAFHPETSHRVEGEAFQVLECEVEAVVVAQDARINT